MKKLILIMLVFCLTAQGAEFGCCPCELAVGLVNWSTEFDKRHAQGVVLRKQQDEQERKKAVAAMVAVHLPVELAEIIACKEQS